MPNKYIYFLMLLLATSMTNCQQKEPVSMKVSHDQLMELLDNPEIQIVDLRTPNETQFGIIEGAVEIDFLGKKFEEKIQALDKDRPTVIYCASGGRSGKAMELFRKNGFKEVYDFSGGFKEWKKRHP